MVLNAVRRATPAKLNGVNGRPMIACASGTNPTRSGACAEKSAQNIPTSEAATAAVLKMVFICSLLSRSYRPDAPPSVSRRKSIFFAP